MKQLDASLDPWKKDTQPAKASPNIKLKIKSLFLSLNLYLISGYYVPMLIDLGMTRKGNDCSWPSYPTSNASLAGLAFWTNVIPPIS